MAARLFPAMVNGMMAAPNRPATAWRFSTDAINRYTE
jgi:hypothetical protein